VAKLIYSAIASLDGYVEDEHGGFASLAPDDEVHAFINELERPIGTYLYGRRMYETMVYWESVPTRDQHGPARDYADIWRGADKIVYSRTLTEPLSKRTRIERDFDPAAGVADIYPQEIIRVFLNLIASGFYAAAKRASETGDGFEPKLRAMTRNLDDRIEIRIRDNGAGIPPEIREKIFNPFFTTKPAGEGTGLGLSMSHDIVVKQHGGTIEVATESGRFTEFIIALPRVMPAQEAGGQRK